VRFFASAGPPYSSRSKADDYVSRSALNGTQIGTNGRKVASEFPSVLHSVLPYFFNNRIFHWSTSNNSSGEQISRLPFRAFSTVCRTIIRVNGLFK